MILQALWFGMGVRVPVNVLAHLDPREMQKLLLLNAKPTNETPKKKTL